MSKKQVSLFSNINQNRDIVCKFYNFWNWYRDFFWSVNHGEKEIWNCCSNWYYAKMRVSNADVLSSWAFKTIPWKKVTNESLQSTFASTINVKMIMTKTSDFFSRLKGTGLVTKCIKPPTSRCQFKIVADWQRLW